MSELKNRVISAISEMEDSRLEAVWYFITRLRGTSWDSIPEVQPDEWDIELLDKIASDAEFHTFFSSLISTYFVFALNGAKGVPPPS